MPPEGSEVLGGSCAPGKPFNEPQTRFVRGAPRHLAFLLGRSGREGVFGGGRGMLSTWGHVGGARLPRRIAPAPGLLNTVGNATPDTRTPTTATSTHLHIDNAELAAPRPRGQWGGRAPGALKWGHGAPCGTSGDASSPTLLPVEGDKGAEHPPLVAPSSPIATCARGAARNRRKRRPQSGEGARLARGGSGGILRAQIPTLEPRTSEAAFVPRRRGMEPRVPRPAGTTATCSQTAGGGGLLQEGAIGESKDKRGRRSAAAGTALLGSSAALLCGEAQALGANAGCTAEDRCSGAPPAPHISTSIKLLLLLLLVAAPCESLRRIPRSTRAPPAMRDEPGVGSQTGTGTPRRGVDAGQAAPWGGLTVRAAAHECLERGITQPPRATCGSRACNFALPQTERRGERAAAKTQGEPVLRDPRAQRRGARSTGQQVGRDGDGPCHPGEPRARCGQRRRS